MNTLDLLIWQSYGVTHKGNKRHHNEDSLLNLPELGLWAVADGMGGHRAGDVASDLIIRRLGELDEPKSLGNFVGMVSDCLHDVNDELMDLSLDYENQLVGSTVVVLLHHGNDGAIIWAGDSRVYRIRNNNIKMLTTDHCLAEEYIAQQNYNRADAYALPDATMLTRAVGGDDVLDLDILRFPLQQDDTYILCSDGLYKELDAQEILQIANHNQGVQSISEALLNTALSKEGQDNISVIVTKIATADY